MGYKVLKTYVCRACGDTLPETFFVNIKNQGYICDRCHNLKCRYNINHSDIERMLLKQKNKCKICGEKINHHNKVVDHCHKSSEVRGLLCKKCNLGLGHFNDNTKFLKNAIKYLNVANTKKSKVPARSRPSRRGS